MTRHKHTHTGLVTPQLPQLWLIAVLRLFAMLVLNVVSTVQMFARRPGVNATRQMPVALPGMKTDTLKEPPAVQQDSPSISAHAEQRSFAARPSKHERGLTILSHTSPSPSVSLTTSAIHLPLLRMGRQTALRRLRLRGIASTAFGGGGGLRALARKTEGAATPTTIRVLNQHAPA